jgi:hypothetical protein
MAHFAYLVQITRASSRLYQIAGRVSYTGNGVSNRSLEKAGAVLEPRVPDPKTSNQGATD